MIEIVIIKEQKYNIQCWHYTVTTGYSNNCCSFNMCPTFLGSNINSSIYCHHFPNEYLSFKEFND